ncbi:erythromycin esterase family protein [Polynucleobacter sinensis]|uniref:erythromycin esterase family protein n=1 Tax=Polynucleobacter sinensis TaxID=1743157 RepID=UPI0007866AC6|nr:erythromycin esterase family protein [Polynucleobacter sinensis]
MHELNQLRQYAIPLKADKANYEPLMSSIGDCRFVLLGEASHGTAEFYRERCLISKKLIQEKGFNAIVIEGDWPDSYRVNDFVKGQSSDPDAYAALGGFQRFPAWMWRNDEVFEFLNWLKVFNGRVNVASKLIGFYGMDLYSLFISMDIVLEYLKKVDPVLAERAKKRYACFDHYNKDSQLYGYLASYGERLHSCEQEVVEQMNEFLKMKEYIRALGSTKKDEFFSAMQNTRLIKNAEEYYRAMFSGKFSSWNLRDQHMVETIAEIDRHLSKNLGVPAKIIVWAHNSHLGDARATQQSLSGELNVGQLMRQKYASEVYSLGFTTYQGYVTAAAEWGASAERKSINPGLEGSYEKLFHQLGFERFLYIFKDNPQLRAVLPSKLLERAIGVVYLPQSERNSHYFYANMTNQFDAVLHIDTTEALKPLEKYAPIPKEDAPETFPSGL